MGASGKRWCAQGLHVAAQQRAGFACTGAFFLSRPVRADRCGAPGMEGGAGTRGSAFGSGVRVCRPRTGGRGRML